MAALVFAFSAGVFFSTALILGFAGEVLASAIHAALTLLNIAFAVALASRARAAETEAQADA